MFASGTGSMRGPQVKTPLLLLLLLLLLAALTKTVLCDDGDAAAPDEAEATLIQEDEAVEAEVVHQDPGADGGGDGDTQISETTPATTHDSPTVAPDPFLPLENTESPIEDDYGSGKRSLPSLDDDATQPSSVGPGDISQKGGEEGLSLIIILIPVVLVVLIIGMIVCGIFINRRWNEKARNQELRKEDPYLDGSSTEKVPMPMFEEDVPSVLELEMEELDQWMKTDGETAKDSTLA